MLLLKAEPQAHTTMHDRLLHLQDTDEMKNQTLGHHTLKTKHTQAYIMPESNGMKLSIRPRKSPGRIIKNLEQKESRLPLLGIAILTKNDPTSRP
jgi:hypothetical protein